VHAHAPRACTPEISRPNVIYFILFRCRPLRRRRRHISVKPSWLDRDNERNAACKKRFETSNGRAADSIAHGRDDERTRGRPAVRPMTTTTTESNNNNNNNNNNLS